MTTMASTAALLSRRLGQRSISVAVPVARVYSHHIPAGLHVHLTRRSVGAAMSHPLLATSHGGFGVMQHFTTSAANGLSDPKIKLGDEKEEEQQQQPEQKIAFLDRVVGQLNGSIKKHPAETLAVLFASDIGSIGAMYGVLTLTGAFASMLNANCGYS